MVRYDSSLKYITSTDTLEARLAKVRDVIDALFLMAASAAETGNYEFYELDDGQTRIYTKYRSGKDVEQAITAFERMENRYLNQLNGRVFTLMDEKNFRSNGCRNR